MTIFDLGDYCCRDASRLAGNGKVAARSLTSATIVAEAVVPGHKPVGAAAVDILARNALLPESLDIVGELAARQLAYLPHP